MITIQVQGLTELLANISAYSQDLADQVDKSLDDGANEIVVLARADAPVGRTGALAQSINATLVPFGEKTITVSVPYGAFVEFGTGSKVFQNSRGFVYSTDLRAYAQEFYVNGKGRMRARPFLFPAFEMKRRDILDAVKRALLPKRFNG